MSKLTLAQISTIVAAGPTAVGMLTDAQLCDASHQVMFGLDPAWIGEEPHLRFEVARCGISEARLVEIDQALWAETTRRNDLLHTARWLIDADTPLSLAA